MILRWQNDTKGWNLGVIKSSGMIATDWLSIQADGVRLSDISKQYLRSLAALVPLASVRETRKAAGWWVKNLRIDDLLSDQMREEGWLHAIEEFQKSVIKSKRA